MAVHSHSLRILVRTFETRCDTASAFDRCIVIGLTHAVEFSVFRYVTARPCVVETYGI